MHHLLDHRQQHPVSTASSCSSHTRMHVDTQICPGARDLGLWNLVCAVTHVETTSHTLGTFVKLVGRLSVDGPDINLLSS